MSVACSPSGIQFNSFCETLCEMNDDEECPFVLLVSESREKKKKKNTKDQSELIIAVGVRSLASSLFVDSLELDARTRFIGFTRALCWFRVHHDQREALLCTRPPLRYCIILDYTRVALESSTCGSAYCEQASDKRTELTHTAICLAGKPIMLCASQIRWHAHTHTHKTGRKNSFCSLLFVRVCGALAFSQLLERLVQIA